MKKKFLLIIAFMLSMFVKSSVECKAVVKVDVSAASGEGSFEFDVSEVNFETIKIKDIKGVFGRIAEKGVKVALDNTGKVEMDFDRMDTSGNHIQGVAKYGCYTIVAASHREKGGTLFIFKNRSLYKQVNLKYGHPGGIDVCGDILAVSATPLHLYDLSPLNKNEDPRELCDLSGITCADSVGITSFGKGVGGKGKLAISEAKNGTVLVIDVQEDKKRFKWQRYSVSGDAIPKIESGDYMQNCSMVTGSDDSIYWAPLKDLNYKESIWWIKVPAVKDQASLYKMNFNEETKKIERKKICERIFKPYGTFMPYVSINEHYRWGASIFPINDGNLGIICTADLPGVAHAWAFNTDLDYHDSSDNKLHNHRGLKIFG